MCNVDLVILFSSVCAYAQKCRAFHVLHTCMGNTLAAHICADVRDSDLHVPVFRQQYREVARIMMRIQRNATLTMRKRLFVQTTYIHTVDVCQ